MITGYDNLPIGKYQKIINALKENADAIDAHVEMLAILNDMNKEDVYNLPLNDYAKLSEVASFLMKDLPKIKGKVAAEYNLNGMRLLPTTDVKKFTAAQYIDYQQMLKEDGKVVELLSTLLVPKGHRYADGYDIADVHQAIAEHLTVMEAFQMSAFFLKRLKTSIGHSLTFLEAKGMLTLKKRKERNQLRAMLRMIRYFFKNGDGLTT